MAEAAKLPRVVSCSQYLTQVQVNESLSTETQMTTMTTTARKLELAKTRDAILAMYPGKDGIPMPDAMHQEPHYVEILATLKTFFNARPDVLVSGDTFIYYVEGDSNTKLSPDCYIAFGVDDEEVRKDDSYIVWRVGKVPDFALEIASKSTWRRDQNEKRNEYARIGIAEYWRFDPTGGDHYDTSLAGDRLVDGVYEPIEVNVGPDGIMRGHSELLGLDLCWVDGKLRFYNPATEEYLRDFLTSESERQAAEAHLASERAARQAAEDIAASERAARQAAEAELARLREQLRSDNGRS